MSTPEAQESMRWLQGIASEYVATLTPHVDRGGALSLDWHNADGSLFMHAEKVSGEWDEWAETIQTPGAEVEQAVRDFYGWAGSTR